MKPIAAFAIFAVMAVAAGACDFDAIADVTSQISDCVHAATSNKDMKLLPECDDLQALADSLQANVKACTGDGACGNLGDLCCPGIPGCSTGVCNDGTCVLRGWSPLDVLASLCERGLKRRRAYQGQTTN